MHFRSTIDTAGTEPEGYNLSYSISLKKFFSNSAYKKKRCSEASHFKIGSSLNFSNIEVALL